MPEHVPLDRSAATERAKRVLAAGSGVNHNDCRETARALAQDVLALNDEVKRLREVHRAEQRRSADRLRECLESK